MSIHSAYWYSTRIIIVTKVLCFVFKKIITCKTEKTWTQKSTFQTSVPASSCIQGPARDYTSQTVTVSLMKRRVGLRLANAKSSVMGAVWHDASDSSYNLQLLLRRCIPQPFHEYYCHLCECKPCDVTMRVRTCHSAGWAPHQRSAFSCLNSLFSSVVVTHSARHRVLMLLVLSPQQSRRAAEQQSRTFPLGSGLCRGSVGPAVPSPRPSAASKTWKNGRDLNCPQENT